MKNIFLSAFLLLTGVSFAQNFTEEFVDSTSVANAGWSMDNNSSPMGSTSWFQGNSTVFAAYSQNNYYAANYNSAADSGVISTWLLSPNRWYQNGDSIIFYTRTTDSTLIPTYADRLQVRFSQNGTSVNTGILPTDLGDFTMQLLEINPTYDTIGYPTGYPCHWRRYMIVLSGLPGAGVSGRFAFRYFVENAGPNGDRSDYIGIDSCAYRSITNGLEELSPFHFSLFPNPTNSGSTLYLQTIGDHSSILISLMDVSGRILLQESGTCLPEGNKVLLPLLNPGFYFLRLSGMKGDSTESLIIR